MSYIEKEKLIKADIVSIENRVRHAFNQGYDLGLKDGEKRAKPQEQEPILDKIRAEIEEHCGLYSENKCKYCYYCHSVMGVREILEVFDKYMPESRKV